MERLREAGLTEAELSRLSSPIVLDLGARTAEETAVSIAAEIIALRWGGTGDRLSGSQGPIHRGEDLHHGELNHGDATDRGEDSGGDSHRGEG